MSKDIMMDLPEEALVPKEEWPYEVPEGWKWVRVGNVFEQIREQVIPDNETTCRYIGLEHLRKDGGIEAIGESDGLKSAKLPFKSGDVLYGKLRPYLNKHSIVDFDGITSTDVIVFREKGLLINKLLDWYLGLPHVINYANANSKGINLPRVSPQIMNNLPIPLPPGKEQKRIIDRVELLLGKINEAKKLIEDFPEFLKHFKQVILTAACSGKLTEGLRERHKYIKINNLNTDSNGKFAKDISKIKIKAEGRKLYKIPDEWLWCNLVEVCLPFNSAIKCGPFGSQLKIGEYISNGIPVFGIDNVTDKGFMWAKEKYISDEKFRELEAFKVTAGDVLITRTGTVGRICIVPEINNEAVIGPNLLKISVNKKVVDPLYAVLYLNSEFAQSEIKQLSPGSTVGVFNTTNLKSLSFPLCSIQEQQEIIQRVETLFKLADQIEEQYETAKEQLDKLLQVVLEKAFRGEL